MLNLGIVYLFLQKHWFFLELGYFVEMRISGKYFYLIDIV